MVAAIELYFTGDAERRIRHLWDTLETAEVPTLREHTHRRHRPHISLAVAAHLEPARVLTAIGDVLEECNLELRLSTVGHFPGGVLWLGPVVTAPLLQLHATVHQRLDRAGIAVDPVYRPQSWVPHCTIVPRLPASQLRDAIPPCIAMLPVDTRVTGAALADHSRGVFHPLSSSAAPKR